MSKTTEDFPIEKVSSVQWSSGMMFGTLTVFASGNKAEIKSMSKDDGKHIADAIRNRLSTAYVPSDPAPQQQQPASAASPPQADIYVQLAKLGELRDAGVLTPEELDAKKAELLSRL